MVFNILFIIIGLIFLVKGADFLVDGSTQIAKKFNISEIVIGMTVVAMGTSMPELLVSVKSSLEGLSDISLGNVIGSNLLNLLLILGICAITKPLLIKKEVRLFDNPFNLSITFGLLLVCNFGAANVGISRAKGIVMLIVFALYIAYMIYKAKKDSNGYNVDISTKKIPMWKAILYILIGAIGLKYGADFVVNNSVEIARIWGISEKVISITIIAIGTSLPELVSSVTAVKKGETDLAIGNIIGSNVFNILLILGTASTIHPINYNTTYNLDILVLFFSSVLLMFFPYLGEKNIMTRREGAIYVLIYIVYMVTLLIR